MGFLTESESLRFWGHVKLDQNGCLVWQLKPYGPKPHQYGRFRLDNHGESLRAHRIAWMELNSEIPQGLVIDHLCRNTMCVNVDHLEVVTNTENLRRRHDVKLSHDKAREIRERYSQGKVTQKYLAKIFGVGQDQISRVINNLAWHNA